MLNNPHGGIPKKIIKQKTGREKFTSPSMNKFLMDSPSRNATDRELKWLGIAGDLALLSDREKKSRTGCIILQKNRVFSHGWNTFKTHPFQSRWNTHTNKLHAEMVAILHAQRCQDFEPDRATIVITRMSRSGPACSYPCIYCFACLSHIGIRTILCYDYNNEPIRIDL